MDKNETNTQTHLPRRKIPGVNGGTLTPFDSARARENALKRWDKYRRDAADAVMREAGSISGATTPSAAWGVLNARLFQQIMDSEKPRGNDVEVLGRNIGALPRLNDVQGQGQGNVTNILAISDTAAQALAQALARLPDVPDVIDIRSENEGEGE